MFENNQDTEVRYYRYIHSCIRLAEDILRLPLGYSLLSHFREEQRDYMERAMEIEKQNYVESE